MPIVLSPLALKIGTSSELDAFFSEEALAPKWIENASFTGRAHLATNKLDSHYMARLNWLFHQLIPLLPKDWQSKPIVILMPAFAASSPDAPSNLFQLYASQLPALSEHSQVHLYPYGRSAFLLALTKLQELLSDDATESVLVIAVDSHRRLCLDSDSSCLPHYPFDASGVTACDGMALIEVKVDSEGLELYWQNKVAQAHVNTSGSAVANLFRHFNKQCLKNIDAIHLPLNNSQPMVDEWITQLPPLASYFNDELKTVFNGIRVGDLGCLTGMFNVLHTQYLYQKKILDDDQTVMQLDIADGLYRSAALFGWLDE
ncbi:hypothetical protein A3K86_19045 [Photobacterium jeanii]|uniref:Beta-ketoacyl synthase N-terminal domain-containing protein n=1 Tax=Photobacterium jeanii TaxID=858640 RepID=A0A178K1B7_9GAMM|nr:hypothetical protein [Photobacterium jeanii]OAN11071.1 hypothetical protein A3K86_19045 [Photobacterium jeanii]PST90585.1 hypothetical protein C9I91_08145 [Photobacterium jeanii]